MLLKVFISATILALVLGLGGLLGISRNHATPLPALHAETQTPAPENNFVSISGDSFQVNGQEFVPFGSTFYPYWDHNGKVIHGSGWVLPEFTQYIDSSITLAKEANLNTLRPTNYFDGISSTDSPNWWKNPTIWSNLDYLLTKAQENNLYVLLDLSAFRDRMLKTGKYPYDPAKWSEFINFVGYRYKDNPTILNYAIAGEVACPTGKEQLRPTGTEALTQFYKTVSDQLRSVDPNHLISTGGLSHLNQKNCGIDWQTIYSLPNNDMSSIHVYSDNDRQITVPMVSKWASAHNKPFTVEEFGFKQDLGDSSRAKAYSDTYTLLSVQNYNARAVIFWNLGPEIAPSSYEVSLNTPLTWQTIIQNEYRKENNLDSK